MDNQVDDTSMNSNSIFQRIILGVVSLFIFLDSGGVILDYLNKVDNYRLHDGMEHGIKLMAFLFVIGICLFTINRKSNKGHFIAVLILGIGIMFNFSFLGVGKFIATCSLTFSFIMYVIITSILDWRKSPKQ